MGSGGGGSSTTTQKSDPWYGVQSYLLDLYSQASNEANTDKTYYPGQTYADLSDTTKQGLAALISAGTSELPTTTAAENETQKTLEGYYLDQSNPYLQNISKSIGQDVSATVMDRFAGTGGYMGSAGEIQSTASEVADALAPYYYNAYENERNRMSDQTSMSAVYESLNDNSINSLLQAGSIEDTQAQNAIDETIARYNYNRDSKSNQLKWLSDILSGASTYSGASSTTDTDAGNQTAQYVGMGVGTAATIAVAIALIA